MSDLLAWSRFSGAVLTGGEARPPSRLPLREELGEAYLLPYVHEALRRVGDARAQELKPELLARAFASATLDATAERVGAALEGAGVRHIFIKGIVARRTLCHVVPQRIISDADVLVDDFGPVTGVLEAAGFTRGSVTRPLHQALFYEQVWVGNQDGSTVLVDVHQRLVPWPLLGGATARLLHDRVFTAGVWAPSPVDRLIVAAVHHAKESVRPDVRDAFDALLGLAMFTEGERRALVERARALGCSGALFQLLRRVERVCGDHAGVNALRRRVERELDGRRRFIERLPTVTPREPRSTAHALAEDGWRFGLLYDGPGRAALAMGRIVGALTIDHAAIRMRRVVGR